MYFPIIFFLLLSPLLAQEADSLINFTLEDQFDRVHQRSDYEGKITILFCSDRDGSKYNDDWAEPIADSLKVFNLYDKVEFIGLADLGNVPYLMRSFVRSMMPKEDNQHPILLDWDGLFSESYNFVEAHSNLIIFDHNFNKISQKALREVKPDTLRDIVEIILSQLKND